MSKDTRVLQRIEIEASLLANPSIPPKDRLQDLQTSMPALFEHVSIKGFKRLISQVSAKGGKCVDERVALALP